MHRLSVKGRALAYAATFPEWAPTRPRVFQGKMYGVWVMGNNYSNPTRYYGAYPCGYLKRLLCMFPDLKKRMMLFSGSLPKGNYVRVDINPANKPDVCVDANYLQKGFRVKGGKHSFDLICADPPYSKEAAENYGYPMINRKAVVAECAKVLRPGGWLAWLDTTLPMFRKDVLEFRGLIGLSVSTNHVFRMTAFFQKRR